MLRIVSVLALVACALPAVAAELPARKPGLWEMKMQREGAGMAMQMQG